jgi:hypothetical protein
MGGACITIDRYEKYILLLGDLKEKTLWETYVYMSD